MFKVNNKNTKTINYFDKLYGKRWVGFCLNIRAVEMDYKVERPWNTEKCCRPPWLNPRRSKMATTVTLWPWWQPLKSFCVETFFFSFASYFSFFYARKQGRGKGAWSPGPPSGVPALNTGKTFFIEVLFQSQWKKHRFPWKMILGIFRIALPAGIYLLKVNNRSTRTTCEICSKLTIKTPERRHKSLSFIWDCFPGEYR